MALFRKGSLDLSAASTKQKGYGAFTRGYRMSENFEDRRGENKPANSSGSTIAATGGGGGGSTGRAKNNESTPDDFGVSDFGAFPSDVTPKNAPGQSRKVNAAEAVDITSNRR